MVESLAGSLSSLGFADGTVSAGSLFNQPHGLAAIRNTSLYVADSSNHAIRLIDLASGSVTTVAGTGSSGSLDGPALSATLSNPLGLVIDPVTQDVYFSDSSSNTIRVLRYSSSQIQTVRSFLYFLSM